MPIKNGTQLITYPDSLGGNLRELDALLRGPLDGLFSGLHILPPFPSSGDRGFAPLTYDEIDPAFGGWEDVERLGEGRDLVLDLMVNHISRRSEYFLDFERRGSASAWRELFLTADKIWPGGIIPPEELGLVARRRPGPPFLEVPVGSEGRIERVWTTFGSEASSEQVDLDVGSSAARSLFDSALRRFAGHGARIARLDAVGYAVKRRGTSCFMVEPDIHEFLRWISATAQDLGVEVLPEIHAPRGLLNKLALQGYRLYDFALPAMVLHAVITGRAERLREYLDRQPPLSFTTLDCHDGIPIRPDLDGVLETEEAAKVVEACVARGANLSLLKAGGPAGGGLDVHQINCSYLDALGRDEDAFVAARAVQLFAPGIPQVYYVGLLAGANDYRAAAETGVGRAVNRHNFSAREVESAVERPVVKRLFRLIRLRNEHPAFGGAFSIGGTGASTIVLRWNAGREACSLDLDFGSRKAALRYTEDGRTVEVVA